ncbi:MAG: hypothetical protein ACKVS9_05030 [Phycisphaerae bacterium]
MLSTLNYTAAGDRRRGPNLQSVALSALAIGVLPGLTAQAASGGGLRAPLDPANAERIASLFVLHDHVAPPPVLSAEYTPLGTVFTYQGQLKEAGSPASGLYDIRFQLYLASSGGTRYVAIAMHSNEAAKRQHEEMGFELGWGTALDQLVALAKTW